MHLSVEPGKVCWGSKKRVGLEKSAPEKLLRMYWLFPYTVMHSFLERHTSWWKARAAWTHRAAFRRVGHMHLSHFPFPLVFKEQFVISAGYLNSCMKAWIEVVSTVSIWWLSYNIPVCSWFMNQLKVSRSDISPHTRRDRNMDRAWQVAYNETAYILSVASYFDWLNR